MNKKQIATKENIKKVVNFLRGAVDWLKKEDCGCCHFNLNNDLAIYCGWSGGFDPKDESYIHSKSEPHFVIEAAVKVRNDFDCADFEFLNYPYDPKTGDCWMTNIGIQPDESEKALAADAKWLLCSFVDMVNARKKNLVVFEK